MRVFRSMKYNIDEDRLVIIKDESSWEPEKRYTKWFWDDVLEATAEADAEAKKEGISKSDYLTYEEFLKRRRESAKKVASDDN